VFLLLHLSLPEFFLAVGIITVYAIETDLSKLPFGDFVECAEFGLEEIGFGSKFLLRMSVIAVLSCACAFHKSLTHLGLFEFSSRGI